MCDNQNRQMQNYLREQPDNIKTINLVSEICIFLHVDATKDNISLINQAIQTLIEISLVSTVARYYYHILITFKQKFVL